MKVSGEATLHAPIDRVWAALNDPSVLVRTIPGCESLESTGPDAYSMVVSAGVASIKGTYSGSVALSDQQMPHSFLMQAAGAGSPGTVSTDVRVQLAELEDGSTRLRYDADAVIGGMIAGVGQRMLAGVAKKMAGEFFAAVDDVLTGVALETAELVTTESGGWARDRVASPRPSSDRAFLAGTVVGAAIALAGVLVGGLLGRRRG